jgi:replicative DNA helicase
MAMIASLALAGDDEALVASILAAAGRNDFYQVDHQVYFDAICALRSRKAKVDAVTIRAELQARGLYEEVGGNGYFGTIINSVPSAAHGEHYARIVRRLSVRRQLIEYATTVTRCAYSPGDEDGTANALLDQVQAKLAEIMAGGGGVKVRTLEEIGTATLIAMNENGGDLIPFGYPNLDRVCSGIGPGENIIIASRPSVGKSMLAKNIAFNMASSGIKVGIFSLEERGSKIYRNLLAGEAGIDNRLLRAVKDLSGGDWAKIYEGHGRLAKLPIWVEDSAFAASDIANKAAFLSARHGVQVFLFDYLQLVDAGGKSDMEKASNASVAIARLVRRLGARGITLAQVNRGVENRENKMPTMADLRSSGQIEQDADGIFLLHREDYYRVTDPNRRSEPLDHVLDIMVAKFRDAERGDCLKLRSSLRFQRFNYDVDLDARTSREEAAYDEQF